MMKNNPIFFLIIIAVILFGLHYALFNYLLTEFFIDGIYKIHLFLGIITVALVYILKKVKEKNQERFGQLFLVSVVLKMFLSVGFLSPIIFGENSEEKIYVIHFFTAFFTYLFLEVYTLTSLLKK